MIQKRWELSTDVGDIQFVNGNHATYGNFTDLEQTAMSILSRMDAMAAEMEYEKQFEHRFHHKAESQLDQIHYFSALKIFMLLGVTVFQIYMLLKYFKSEKLFWYFFLVFFE